MHRGLACEFWGSNFCWSGMMMNTSTSRYGGDEEGVLYKDLLFIAVPPAILKHITLRVGSYPSVCKFKTIESLQSRIIAIGRTSAASKNRRTKKRLSNQALTILGKMYTMLMDKSCLEGTLKALTADVLEFQGDYTLDSWERRKQKEVDIVKVTALYYHTGCKMLEPQQNIIN